MTHEERNAAYKRAMKLLDQIDTILKSVFDECYRREAEANKQS